jgi:hypothetical protein
MIKNDGVGAGLSIETTGDNSNSCGLNVKTSGTYADGIQVNARGSTATGIYVISQYHGIWSSVMADDVDGIRSYVGGSDARGFYAYAYGQNGMGVYGKATSGIGVQAWGGAFDFYAENTAGTSYFAGKVGIGTKSPERQLEIEGSNPRILLDATSSNPELNLSASGQTTWAIYQSSSSGDLRFYQSSDKVTIQDSSGNVGVGKTDPSYKLDVNGTIRGNNVSPSDVRLKKEIKTIENALERVTSLRGTNFKWIDKESDNNLQMGVIAQEVEAIFPEVVSTDAQGYKSVAYGKLVAPLIEAVKELKAENEMLKAEVKELQKLISE